jgi:hypothetical protein
MEDQVTIISFLSYEDFVNELAEFEDIPIWHDNPVVRVQHSRRTINVTGPMEMLEAEVLAAAQCNGETLVARFIIGHAWQYDDAKLGRLGDMADKAVKLLVADLTQRGYTVRPGIIAGTEDTRIRTTANGLWTVEQLNGDENAGA